MTGSDLAGFSEEEFEEQFRAVSQELSLNPWLSVDERPRAFLLGGQSGAGKTSLHKILVEEFDKNVLIINGDEYRSRHPRFHDLAAEYGADAVSHTALWSGKMVETPANTFSVARYNLVVEGTLRTSKIPLQTANLLKGRGYEVSLALMAVKPDISLISCQIRCELMRMAGTTPRATDPAHHNKIISDIVDNMGVLEESGLFYEIRLYSRDSKLLFPRNKETRSAAHALGEVLFGEWTIEEKQHYAFLEEKLASLKSKKTKDRNQSGK